MNKFAMFNKRIVIITILSLTFLFSSALNELQAKTIHVDDFGAKADGVFNSHPAIAKAFEKSTQFNGAVTIQFAPGKYIIGPEFEAVKNESPDCFKVSDVRNLTVQGDPAGTELVITSPLSDVLRIFNGADIVIKDLVVDYDPLPFTQGNIVAVDIINGTFDMDLDTGFPSLSEFWFSGTDVGKWGFSYDKDGQFRLGAKSAVFTRSWEHVENRIWRMSLQNKNDAANLRMGDRFMHMARTGGKAVFFFCHCKNVSVQNVVVYSNNSSAIQFYECDGDLHVNGLVVRPRPGTGRLLSTNADAVHCQANRKGPKVENCLFEWLADDPMNFYAAPSIVTKVIAANMVEVDTPRVLRAGDMIQIIAPEKGILRAAKVEVTKIEGRVITIAREVEGLHAGSNRHVDSDTIYNLSACSAGYIIRNNILGGLRGRGIVIRGGNGIIENNLIKDTSGQGLVIANEPMWPEGPMPYNVTIRNNVLWNVGRDEMYNKGSSAILIAGHREHNWQPAQDRGVQKILVEDNLIINPPNTAFLIMSAQDVVLRNNMVHIVDGHDGLDSYMGVVLQNCEDVEIEQLLMADAKKRFAAGIVIDPLDGDEPKNIHFNHITADLTEKGKLVLQKNGR